MPVSATSMTTRSPSAARARLARPPEGVNFTAFEPRLISDALQLAAVDPHHEAGLDRARCTS